MYNSSLLSTLPKLQRANVELIQNFLAMNDQTEPLWSLLGLNPVAALGGCEWQINSLPANSDQSWFVSDHSIFLGIDNELVKVVIAQLMGVQSMAIGRGFEAILSGCAGILIATWADRFFAGRKFKAASNAPTDSCLVARWSITLDNFHGAVIVALPLPFFQKKSILSAPIEGIRKKNSPPQIELKFPIVLFEDEIAFAEIAGAELGDIFAFDRPLMDEMILKVGSHKISCRARGNNNVVLGERMAAMSIGEKKNLLQAEDIPVEVSIECGQVTVSMARLLELVEGDVLVLDKGINDSVAVRVNGQQLARGELLNIEGQLGVKLVEICGSATSKS